MTIFTQSLAPLWTERCILFASSLKPLCSLIEPILRKEEIFISKLKECPSTWIEAIEDGRKGDVLTLFALSILTDVHLYVHLHLLRPKCI